MGIVWSPKIKCTSLYALPLLHLKLKREVIWLDSLLFLFLFAVILQIGLLHSEPPSVQVRLLLVWLVLILSMLLGLPRLFYQEWSSGILTYYQVVSRDLTSRMNWYLLIWWMSFTLPLLVAIPVILWLLSIPVSFIGIVMALWLTASPALLGVGAIGSALTLGLNSNALLICVLVLPLYLPLMIVGAKLLLLATLGLDLSGPMYLLMAMSLLAVLFCPFAIRGALRCHL